MKIEIKTYVNLTPELASLDQKLMDENFEIVDTEDPEIKDMFFLKPDLYIMAFVNDELVGRALLTKKIIFLNEVEIKIAGFGGLVVKKEFRRKGIARELASVRFDIAKGEWLFDIAYLTTDINKLGPLFTTLGFEAYNKLFYYRGKSGKIYWEESAMFAPLNSYEKFRLIMDMPDKELDFGEGNI